MEKGRNCSPGAILWKRGEIAPQEQYCGKGEKLLPRSNIVEKGRNCSPGAILWKRGEIAPQERFLLLATIFCNLILDFCVKTRTRYSLRDKRIFEIIEVEITRVDCTMKSISLYFKGMVGWCDGAG